MITYTKNELQEIIDSHKKWLNNEGGVRADLSRANLKGVNLKGVNLAMANFSESDISDACIAKANFSRADFSRADLSRTDISEANLTGANLSEAYFIDANLANVNLSRANLSDAIIKGANLANVYLEGAMGELKYIKSIQCEKYSVVYTFDRIYIGCKNYSIVEWKNFTESEIDKMDVGAFIWWSKWKPIIMQLIEMSPALENYYA
ncbi:MAG: pentapeptide repeat-containing protein [Ignisphaera sp.]|nr:pentapeptide repeat-containing protein [Ignisphaera sp.]